MQFQKIKSIKSTESQDIINLTVKNNHNFFGNNLCLHNCGYRGDMSVKVYNHSGQDYEFKKGDKVAQIVVYKLIQAQISWIDKAEETIRGEKGFGSSDIKPKC